MVLIRNCFKTFKLPVVNLQSFCLTGLDQSSCTESATDLSLKMLNTVKWLFDSQNDTCHMIQTTVLTPLKLVLFV